jgi:hypothetical protein
MSRRLRFCFAAFVLLASFSTSPASSNPFADVFNVGAHTPTPASPERECLSRPGQSTADGQHWVYRLDGHRKCWFQAAEGIATSKKRVHHHAPKHRVTALASVTAGHKREAVDARAELLRSPSAETSQPTSPGSEPKVVDAAPGGGAALAPLGPFANSARDQLTPVHPTPRQLDVETLQAAASAASDAVAASPPVAIFID